MEGVSLLVVERKRYEKGTSDEEEEKPYLSVEEQTRKELEQPPKRADGAQDGRGPVLVGVHRDHVDQACRARRRDAEAHVQLRNPRKVQPRSVRSACRQGGERIGDEEKGGNVRRKQCGSRQRRRKCKRRRRAPWRSRSRWVGTTGRSCEQAVASQSPGRVSCR